MKKPLRYGLIGLVVLAVIVPLCPYHFTASPDCKLRVVDDDGKAITNITVTRSWQTSEHQKGEEQEKTDADGVVRFDKESASVPLVQRLVRPLLGFVPAPCGPESEFYQLTEFRVYWPEGYTMQLDPKSWRHVQTVYRNRDGICIRDPAFSKRERHDAFAFVQSPNGGAPQFMATNRVESCAELYFFNRERDFEFTLQLHKLQPR